MKRILALILTLLLLTACFTACQSKEEAVFNYDGYSITASQYRYWVANYKTEILKYHGVRDSEAFWKTEISDGLTMEAYYTPIIDGVVKNYCIAQALYRRYGLAIASDVKAAISDDIAEKIELYGSRAEVNAALAPLGIDIGGLKEIYTLQEKYNTVYDHLFGENGTMAATPKEVQDYYESTYHRMMYIVFETTEAVLDQNGKPQYDPSGTLITKPISDEELARKKNLMEDLKTRAGLGDEQTFIDMIEEYSANDLSDYENGLYVSSNEAANYGTKIIDELKSMKPGECRIVEETGFLFLIRKFDLTPFAALSQADITAQLANLEYYASQELCAAMYAELHDEIEINEAVKAELTLTKVSANTDRNF